MSQATIERYFDAFNRNDVPGMLDCLAEDVAHHVNEGNIRIGRAAFEAFCQHMARCYDETLTELVVFVAEDGTLWGGGIHGQRNVSCHRFRFTRGQGAGIPSARGVVLFADGWQDQPCRDLLQSQ